ncbi:amidoligase family protein [Ruminococcaceae bacterium OttesenSCG-928-L11]|nr:amidoligase family protein [Ruminococcaceae bacterium OttesenSCG-928-L11]
MRDQNFGIEIELTGLTRQRAAEIAAEYFGTTARYEGGGYRAWSATDQQGRKWNFVSDSSIDTESRHGREAEAVELVSPICVYDDIPTIQELIRKLRGAGALANDSCGIHVHINAAPYDAQKLRNLTNIMASKEDLIYKALQVDVDREHNYCQKVDNRFLEELNRRRPRSLDEVQRIWYDGRDGSHEHYHSSRYHCLNLHSVFQKGTVEFRLFNGTTHAGKIKAYIQLCLAISNQALSQKSASRQKTVSTNEKYTFRTWLLRLGMIGDEFKTARGHLLEHLEGGIAWKDPAQAERQKERLAQRREQQAAEPVPQQEQSAPISTETEEMELAEAEQDLGFSMSM